MKTRQFQSLFFLNVCLIIFTISILSCAKSGGETTEKEENQAESGDAEMYMNSVSSEDSLSVMDAVQKFRSFISLEKYEEARGMMAEDARRWWESREGRGEPWHVGPNSGPWAEWDKHFRTKNNVLEWRVGKNFATAVNRETNDYFQLLERGWVSNEITYFFNESGKIDGLLIRAVGERPPGRTDEFITWAEEHYPEELNELMPEGEIDPSGDHPQRFRKLLNKWRKSIGLNPIE